MIIAITYPDVLRLLVKDGAHLIGTWCTREFWLQRLWQLHWVSLGALVVFWVSSIYVVNSGGPAPLLAWMISAFCSVIASTQVNWQIYSGLIGTDEQRRICATAMLLLNFLLIIVGNFVMIVVMAVKGWGFGPDDFLIVTVALAGTLVVRLCTRKRSPWRLAGYAISQKSAPQVVQAWNIFTTAATLPLLAILSLLVQGSSRLALSTMTWLPVRKNHTDKKPLAQFVNAGADWLTVAAIFAGVAHDVGQ